MKLQESEKELKDTPLVPSTLQDQLETTPTANPSDQKLKELEETVKTLKFEKRELEEKLENCVAADKEKTDLILAEKKAKQHVRERGGAKREGRGEEWRERVRRR